MTATATRTVETAFARAESTAASAVFTLRLTERALQAAETIDRGSHPAAGLRFAGVPISVKDNFDIAGFSTTAGSRLLADAPVASRNAPVVDRLSEAGFILIGRTNMTEFAFSGLGLNPHFGTPANPAFDGEARLPGGSSSGAAVSVGLGITSAAIGTDTGGSIRIPAALCGLVGFKPTADAISREGVLPLSTTLDSVGVIARSVAECTDLFDVIRDQHPQAKPASPSRPLRLALVRSYVMSDLSDEVTEAFEATIALLGDKGVEVAALDLPELERIPEITAKCTFPGFEAAGWHAPYLIANCDPVYDPRVLVRIRAGQSMRADDYAALITQRQALIEKVTAKAADYDALIWPTVPFTAPTIASLADDRRYHTTNGLALRNPSVVNLLDGCAISLPCRCPGAPVGLTLAAFHGQDDHLLSIAAEIEAIIAGAFQ